jgi:hypothetical protein
MVPQWCRQNPHFTGRPSLLDTLRDKLCDNQPRQFNHRIALFGMGGVGKTQVAIEYVIKYKTKYNAVFWMTAANSASLLLGYQQMATLTECVVTSAMDAESVAKEVLKLMNVLHETTSTLFIERETTALYTSFQEIQEP